MKALSLKTCYALAWKSFSKWWIPLCLIPTTGFANTARASAYQILKL